MNVIVKTKTNAQAVSVGIQGPAGPTGPTGPTGPVGPASGISVAYDVDISNLQNDSLLIYKTNTNKWTATKELNAQDMDAGEY